MEGVNLRTLVFQPGISVSANTLWTIPFQVTSLASIVSLQAKLLPEGFEPTTPDSKSGVLTTTLWELHGRKIMMKTYIFLCLLSRSSLFDAAFRKKYQ